MIQTLKSPTMWAWFAALVIWGAFVRWLLPEASATAIIPLFNSFAIIVLLLRDVRVRREDAIATILRIEHKLDDVIVVVNLASEARRQEFADAKIQIAKVDAAMRIVTAQKESEAAAALHNQTSTILSKIEEGTAASKEAQREANSVNQKIADLDKRIGDSLAPRAQVDDIQVTSHLSLDILDTMIKKAD